MSGVSIRHGLQEHPGGDHELEQAQAEQDNEVVGFMVIIRQQARPAHTTELPTVHRGH